ncbi:AAA domain-containing protein [Syncephalis plumigaleata]|nr:AAA domain-containing protein [Syncephalis plumigaleata]
MNSDIMLVSNRLIYNQQMVCGSDVVAQQQLDLPIPDGLAVLHADTNDHLVDVHDSSESITCDGSACWLDYLLQPEHKVILANTDTLYPDNTIKENILHNHTEARLVYQTVEALISCGITESNIGVITPYRSQVRVISLLLKERPEVEVYTVDRYQGRDKDCILLSMVRSNAEQNVGNLLRDWRRMNVAFTRARKKLIIFGSVSTLNGSSVFTKFLALMKEQQWIYPLPVLAHRRHDTRTELTFNSQPESNLSPVSRRQQHRSRTGPVKRSVTLNDQVLLRHHPLLRDIVGEAMTTTHHDDDYDQ